MTDFSILNLTQNPFEDISARIPSQEHHLIWAGHQSLRAKIEEAYRLSDTTRQVVLNWGSLGAGKTFAAHFFSQKFSQTQHICLEIPKEGNNAVIQLCKSIFDSLGFETIQAKVQDAVSKMGREQFVAFLKSRINSQEFAHAIAKLADDDSLLMRAFVYSGLSKTDLRKAGLVRALENDSDYAKFLSGVLLAFIGDGVSYSGKVVLWLDELEDLLNYSGKQYKIFAQSLRDISDKLNDRFLLFLNFTLANSSLEDEENSVRLLLGDALWSRVNTKIRFSALTLDEAMLYCKDLLNAFQIEQGGYAPFEEEALKSFLEKIPLVERLPRQINLELSELLYFALEHKFDKLNRSVINEFFESSKISL